VHLLHGSPYTRVLESLSAKEKLELNIVTVEEDLDAQTMLLDVTEGERPLTVVDDLHLDAVESYDDNVERLFKLSDRRELGWAVRKENPELLAAVNQFILGRFESASGNEPSTGDLDTIKERGSLRVLTLNNPVSYFLHRGQQMGFDYELALLAARQLGVRLEMVVPPEPDLLIPWLLEGRGDVIAASLAVTSDRSERLAFSLPYMFFDEVLVQASGTAEKLAKRSDLRGKRVHVRRSSSYYPALVALREKVGPFEIVEAPEYLETTQLLGMVGEGRIPLTVADSHLVEAEIAYRHDVEAVFPISVNKAQKAAAFALRPANVQLKAFFDRFVKDTVGSVEYEVALQRYFKSPRARNVERASPVLSSDALTPYDVLLKRYSETYRLDWRLMAAQVYQESQFHADAQNWAGASGLFQIMPLTARELGFGNVMQPDESIHSGVKYMSQLVSRLESRIPQREKHFFALAAYNAGWNHVRDARRLAAQNEWNPNKWFGHTEKAMRLLEQPRYYRRARSGFCRGSATADYVLQVQSRYEHYAAHYPQ
jgi:membrane-bound lytic murein transglycosylase F